jgi:hypothetical protein
VRKRGKKALACLTLIPPPHSTFNMEYVNFMANLSLIEEIENAGRKGELDAMLDSFLPNPSRKVYPQEYYYQTDETGTGAGAGEEVLSHV